MSPAVQAVGGLTGEQMAHVLAAAEAAPTFRGSRPWHLHCTATTVELRVNRPSGGTGEENAAAARELVLACGAALFNARAAIRGFSVDPAVQLLPDPGQPDLLALLRPAAGSRVGPGDTAITAAIIAAITADSGDDHAGRSPGPHDRSQLDRLRRAARTEYAWLAVFPPGHLRDHDGPIAARPPAANGPPEPTVAVIGTIHDDPVSWLHAGQATQLVRLTATTLGLTAPLLLPPLDPAARRELRDRIGGALWPQTGMRLLRR